MGSENLVPGALPTPSSASCPPLNTHQLFVFLADSADLICYLEAVTEFRQEPGGGGGAEWLMLPSLFPMLFSILLLIVNSLIQMKLYRGTQAGQSGRRQATRVEPRNDCRPRPHACLEELGKAISWDLVHSELNPRGHILHPYVQSW